MAQAIAPARRRARRVWQEGRPRGAARSVAVLRATAAFTRRVLDPEPERIRRRRQWPAGMEATEESPLVLGPRETPSAHREVLTHPGVEARRQFAVQMFEEPGHHFFAGGTGLDCVAHGSVRSAAKR